MHDILHLHDPHIGLAKPGTCQAKTADLNGLESSRFDDHGAERIMATRTTKALFSFIFDRNILLLLAMCCSSFDNFYDQIR